MSFPLLNGIPFLGGITLVQNARFFDGSQGAPSITFQNEPNMGFYRLGAGVTAYTCGGVASMLFQSGGTLAGAGVGSALILNTSGQINLTAYGTNQNIVLAASGAGIHVHTKSDDGLVNALAHFLNAGAVTAGRYNEILFGKSLVAGGAGSLGYKSDTATTANSRLFLCHYGASEDTGGINLTLGGSVLFGTTTDSSNGRLQLATHTTSAGGIGFGTDIWFHRSSANELVIGGTSRIGSYLGATATYSGWFSGTGGTGNGWYYDTSNNFKIQTNGTTALTLDASQNATFAGSVIAAATLAHSWNGRSQLSSGSDGSVELLTSAAAAGSNFSFGASGAATSARIFRKHTTGIANATATSVLTITIPNAAHAARLRIEIIGILGAGGAVGACEAAQSVYYDATIVRTTGVNAVATLSAVDGTAAANVAGATTCTTSAALSAVSGAVGAVNSFTLNVTISRAAGTSTNHTCHVLVHLLNSNASGITVA